MRNRLVLSAPGSGMNLDLQPEAGPTTARTHNAVVAASLNQSVCIFWARLLISIASLSGKFSVLENPEAASDWPGDVGVNSFINRGLLSGAMPKP